MLAKIQKTLKNDIKVEGKWRKRSKNSDKTKAIMGEVLTEHFSTIFVHTFWEIGGVLFWRGDIFSSQLGSF